MKANAHAWHHRLCTLRAVKLSLQNILIASCWVPLHALTACVVQAVIVYSPQQLYCTPCSPPAVLAPAPPAEAADASGLLLADPPDAPALPAANVGTEYQPAPAPAPASAAFEVADQPTPAPAPAVFDVAGQPAAALARAPADFEVVGQLADAPAPPPAVVQAPAAPPAEPAVLAPPPAQPATMYGGMQLAAQHVAATIGNALVLVRQRLAQSASSGLSFFSNKLVYHYATWSLHFGTTWFL